MLNTTLGG